MKTPLCDFCLRSGVLCPRCQEKVRSGEIGETDVEVAKLLLSLQDRYPSLQKISFYKAHKADGVLAILVATGDLPHLLGYGGKILRDIAQKTGGNVRILEKGGDFRKFIEDLLAPVNVVSLNTIWLPDGTTETKIIIAGHSRRLPIDVKTLKELTSNIYGKTIRVEFEMQRR